MAKVICKALIYMAVFQFFFSCTSTKKVSYFQNFYRDTIIKKNGGEDLEQKIVKGDVLGITISSINPEASSVYNFSSSSVNSNGSNQPGYVVDNDGNIFMVQIGRINVEGKTKNDLKNDLEKRLLPYLKNPLVNVKFLNQKVTVIGEVTHPTVIPLNNEKLSLIDAIALSGEILPTGRKDNLLIVRETDTSRIFKRINLTNSSIFSSEVFYLKPNDIVFVERKKAGGLSPEVTQLISLALGTISLIIVIIKGFK